ncbi:hypothetical protein CLV59_10979 [Chitinophaga dinghuensis]|uniref:Lipoprotein n=1 Tax=Chitinophaga dinghuensis TaxID=1539050 RepID=A0A327VNS3_9BACT|nr:hypothetical protein [Chitinophaga dinghuensis]RAJ75465.1 hypothetical protein CLV59_10979 [Chitinophaga dinghuensis]
MKNHPSIIILALLFGISACNIQPDKTKSSSQDKFINLPGYFKTEEKQLSQASLDMEKTVLLNGKSEKNTFNSSDTAVIQHLMKPFIDVDLNKPSLRDEYDTTSLTDPFSGRKSVIYKSRGQQTNPEEITMDLDKNGVIQQVSVHSYTSNMVYEYRQHLVYQRGKSVMINTYQKIAFLSPKELEITVKPIAKNQL